MVETPPGDPCGCGAPRRRPDRPGPQGIRPVVPPGDAPKGFEPCAVNSCAMSPRVRRAASGPVRRPSLLIRGGHHRTRPGGQPASGFGGSDTSCREVEEKGQRPVDVSHRGVRQVVHLVTKPLFGVYCSETITEGEGRLTSNLDTRSIDCRTSAHAGRDHQPTAQVGESAGQDHHPVTVSGLLMPTNVPRVAQSVDGTSHSPVRSRIAAASSARSSGSLASRQASSSA